MTPAAAGAGANSGMERRPFGLASRDVPVIGPGAWSIDIAHRPMAIATLQRGLDLGLTHIDTADPADGAVGGRGTLVAPARSPAPRL